MPRNKYPELTVSHILEVSLKLFNEQGYDEVKMQDIVEELGGLTKGAVYHYFKNKEEIFDALLDRYDQILEPIYKIQNSSLSGLMKMKKVISEGLGGSTYEKETVHFSGGLFQTSHFIKRQMENNRKKIAPIFQEIIEQGNADGSLSVIYPMQAAECLALLLNIWMNPTLYPAAEDQYMQKVFQLRIILNGMDLPVIDDEVLERFKWFYKNLTCKNNLP